MGLKVLDPKTATLEEVAAASRRLRRAKQTAVVVGAIVAAATWYFVVLPQVTPEGWTLPILAIAFAVGYIVTEEILKRR